MYKGCIHDVKITKNDSYNLKDWESMKSTREWLPLEPKTWDHSNNNHIKVDFNWRINVPTNIDLHAIKKGLSFFSSIVLYQSPSRSLKPNPSFWSYLP